MFETIEIVLRQQLVMTDAAGAAATVYCCCVFASAKKYKNVLRQQPVMTRTTAAPRVGGLAECGISGRRKLQPALQCGTAYRVCRAPPSSAVGWSRHAPRRSMWGACSAFRTGTAPSNGGHHPGRWLRAPRALGPAATGNCPRIRVLRVHDRQRFRPEPARRFERRIQAETKKEGGEHRRSRSEPHAIMASAPLQRTPDSRCARRGQDRPR